MKFFAFLMLTAFCRLSLSAQELQVPRNYQRALQKSTRQKDGRPGKSYWQNTADYSINISFDPFTRLLQGSEDVEYVNNSPDTLHQVVFKLYPNYYKKGGVRSKEINPEDISAGMEIGEILVNGKEIPAKDRRVDATTMVLKTTLYPGKRAAMSLRFSYTLNKGSHNRTGQVDDLSFFLAYFYPRIAVYDDIDGWDMYPYTGSYEFYHDFCNFSLSLKLPAEFLVWATGDHVNREEVFEAKYVELMRMAETEDGPVNIIDSSDLINRADITRGEGVNVWKFQANNVTDMAVAISANRMWQSTSLVVDSQTMRRTRVDAVFSPSHSDFFMVLDDAKKTIESMSFRFPRWPFPFSHETVFDGLDQMEYPMMANDNPLEDRAESIELTDHEIFHSMFPFYMGINETKYGWMDEGWATLGEWLITPMIDPSIIDQYGLWRYERSAGMEVDGTIMQLTPGLVGEGAFLNSYPKPALGYLYVKDMLGDELFFKALHHYIRIWNGKHPLPLDFFHCMNEGSGQDLNWFWKAWFYEPGVPDLAITAVSQNGKSKKVVVERLGEKPVPADITVMYEDGGRDTFHKPVSVWKDGSRKTIFSFQSDKKITSVELGSTYTVDIDKSNNLFTVK